MVQRYQIWPKMDRRVKAGNPWPKQHSRDPGYLFLQTPVGVGNIYVFYDVGRASLYFKTRTR